MKAASLFEVLIVLAIFSMVVMIAFPFSLQLINQNRADGVAKQVAYEVFHQQQAAYSGSEGAAHGVAFYQDRMVSFVGSNLATATSSVTIPFDLPIKMNSIVLGGGNEVVFLSGSLQPVTSGYLLVTDASKSFRITINSEGLISYYAQ
jgi:Tfp pilus assembly protein FimT